MFPKGNFDGNSTYEAVYIGGPAAKNQQFRPSNNLSVARDAKFDGGSSYTIEYDRSVGARRQFNREGHFIPRSWVFLDTLNFLLLRE